MSVTAGSVEIDISLNDNTSESIAAIGTNMQSLRQDINDQNSLVDSNAYSWQAQRKQVNLAYQEQRFIRREFMLSHQPFYQTTALLSSIGHAGMRMNSMFLQYNAIGIHQAAVDQRVADAKEKLAEAVAKYGAGSKQAANATEDLNKAMQAQSQFNMTLPGQYAALGMGALGFAGDLGRVALQMKLWKSDIGKAGGMKNVLGNFFGGNSMSSQLGGSALPSWLGGGKSNSTNSWKSGGLISKLGGMRGVGMLAAGGTGLAMTQMFESGMFGSAGAGNDKLIGTLGNAGSMAMMGMAAGPWGALAGGIAGLGLGIAQNYHEEFANLFSGKGFLSNKDAEVNVNLNVSSDPSLKVQSEVMKRTMHYVESG